MYVIIKSTLYHIDRIDLGTIKGLFFISFAQIKRNSIFSSAIIIFYQILIIDLYDTHKNVGKKGYQCYFVTVIGVMCALSECNIKSTKYAINSFTKFDKKALLNQKRISVSFCQTITNTAIYPFQTHKR